MSDSLQPHGLQHTRLPCPTIPQFKIKFKKCKHTHKPTILMVTISRWKDWVLNFCCYCFFKSSEIHYQNIFLLCWGSVGKKSWLAWPFPVLFWVLPVSWFFSPSFAELKASHRHKVGHSNQETAGLRKPGGLSNLVCCADPLSIIPPG